MNGKKPTMAQRKLIKAWGLNHENWLVIKNAVAWMEIKHRISGKTKIINKAV